MKRQVALLLIIGLVLIGAFAATVVQAQGQPPPLPHAFYGSVDVNGQPAPVGAQIEARGTGVKTGIQTNPITVTVAGQYGGPTLGEPKLGVQGDLQDGDPIEFYVNGVKAKCAVPDGAWQDSFPFNPGVVTKLNLAVNPVQDATDTPTATATATPTTAPTPTTSGAVVVPSSTVRASTTDPTGTPQPTATRQATQSVNATTIPVSTARNGLSQPAQPVTTTSSPAAVVTKPTGVAAAPLDASPVPPAQIVQATLAPITTETPIVEATTLLPTATAAKVAAVPNATVKPILDEAKPPESVQSTLSQTDDSSGRRTALWAGLGLVLVAIAIGVLVKVRGLPR
jgi:hypothetical protein